MSDVTLSASVRQSLLSLQGTTNLIERTQNRLSTGLKVSSAIDDPVAFFQAKSLSDRAGDFLEKKDGIDQGINSVTAALDGVEAIEDLVAQMKGISNSMKSATDAQMADLVAQFNDLREQIDDLAADATYQGTNLINGTGTTLSIEFSDQSGSLLDITSVDLRSTTAGLAITENAYYTGDDSVTHAAINAATGASSTIGGKFLSTTSDFTLTYQGSDVTFSAGETVSFTYGTGSTFNFTVGTSSALTVSNGEALVVDVVTASSASTGDLTLVASDTRNLYVSYTATDLSGFVGSNGITGTTSTYDSFTVTYLGEASFTLTTADNGLVFTDGTNSYTVSIATGGSVAVTGASDTIAIQVFSAAGAAVNATGAYVITTQATATGTAITAATATTQALGIDIGGSQAATANGGEFTFTGLVKAGDTTRINSVIDQLDTALTTLRTNSQKLGSNVALLNTRLDFTEQYVNTLQGGSDKLTLADINEEGANLLALQTRQQLGIQSLSLAAQAESSILSLFG